MANFRDIAAELTRALCVLALLVFGLGAAPASPTQVGASPAVAAAIAQSLSSELCGGGFGDDHAHIACHACRANVPILPPPPCVAVPVAFAAEPAFYTPLAEITLSFTLGARPPARGPPATYLSL